jgi:hypothetical protein
VALNGQLLGSEGAPFGRSGRQGSGPHGRTVPVGGDGEPLGALPLLGAEPAVARVLPAALTVLAP